MLIKLTVFDQFQWNFNTCMHVASHITGYNFSQFGSVVQEILSISQGTDIKNHTVEKFPQTHFWAVQHNYSPIAF